MNHFGRAFTSLALWAVTTGAIISPTTRDVLIHTGDVSLRESPDTSQAAYYTVSYSLPEGLVADRLERAILEVYVDVSAKVRSGYINEAPVLELYALEEAFGLTLDPAKIDDATRAVRPVAAGNGRRVVLDVTGIVRAHLTGRLSNNGLVLGSVTGMREGQFILVQGRLPGGALGRLRFYTTEVTR